MGWRWKRIPLGLGLLALSACSANVGAGKLSIPADSQQTCENQCHAVGEALDSMVLIAGQVGCVCRPPGAAPGEGPAKVSASAGGAAALVLAQQQQQQLQAAHR